MVDFHKLWNLPSMHLSFGIIHAISNSLYELMSLACASAAFQCTRCTCQVTHSIRISMESQMEFIRTGWSNLVSSVLKRRRNINFLSDPRVFLIVSVYLFWQWLSGGWGLEFQEVLQSVESTMSESCVIHTRPVVPRLVASLGDLILIFVVMHPLLKYISYVL